MKWSEHSPGKHMVVSSSPCRGVCPLARPFDLPRLLQLTKLEIDTSIVRELICGRPASYPGGVLYCHSLALRNPGMTT